MLGGLCRNNREALARMGRALRFVKRSKAIYPIKDGSSARTYQVQSRKPGLSDPCNFPVAK